MKYLYFFLFVLGIVGCTNAPSDLPDGGLPPLRVDRVDPTTVLPATWIHLYGLGFVDADNGKLSVKLDAASGGSWSFKPERLDDGHIKFQIEPDQFQKMGGVGRFVGTLTLVAEYTASMSQSKKLQVNWSMVENLQPQLEQFSASGSITYLGSQVTAAGSGFLLEGEGETQLRFSGTFVPEGQTGRELTAVPMKIPAKKRDELLGMFPADLVGLVPGSFQGTVTPVNVHQDGEEIAGPTLTDVSFEMGPTVLTGITPSSASRGQWIEFQGRGFVAGAARTVIRIEGTFTDKKGRVTQMTGDSALEIVPEVLSGDKMRYVLRVTSDGRGGVTGLGAVAGVLQGTATPIVYLNSEKQEGVALGDLASFAILPQKQVVFISFLPGFTDALRLFGLRNVEDKIRARVFERCTADYADYSLEFRSARPTDFAEYSVIEVGGEDPNHQDLMGLDNTMGKDIGNLRFDDIVGGYNAMTRESGSYAFGGEFIATFLEFSPKSARPMPISSPRFDDIFGPFMESQGGSPVDANEYPGGSRSQKIDQAIRCLGSMVGNTVSHEIGHTLGLAPGADDYFHTQPPGPNQLMDSGGERSFEERCEIDGEGPAVWSGEDLQYLKKILPKE